MIIIIITTAKARTSDSMRCNPNLPPVGPTEEDSCSTSEEPGSREQSQADAGRRRELAGASPSGFKGF